MEVKSFDVITLTDWLNHHMPVTILERNITGNVNESEAIELEAGVPYNSSPCQLYN
jgi:hypothetical protein